MYETLYVEINILCILILIYVLGVWRRDSDKRSETIAFNRVVYSTIAILALDAVWMLVEQQRDPAFIWLNMTVNILYMILSGTISYFWFYYVELKLNRDIASRRFMKILIALPLLVLILLCVSAPANRLLFYIDESNVYHRGPIHLYQLFVSYGYLFAASMHAVRCTLRAKGRRLKNEYRTLALFVVLPGICGIIGLLYFGIPVVWPATTLSLLMVYINFQRFQISRDGLTGLNNRHQFDKYLGALISDPPKTDKLFLLLMDIDSFKSINDIYGHIEGDNALMQTSAALQSACGTRDAFLARYGGDEFAIVYICRDALDTKLLMDDIRVNIARSSIESHTKYKLSLSVGCAEFDTERMTTASELISVADKLLYTAKRETKAK